MLIILLSLAYCYFFVTYIKKGVLRVIFLLPVLYIFFIFPWFFSSSSLLRGVSSFFITWIASFKLLLYCFNQAPLIVCENYIDFAVIAVFPVKMKENHPRLNQYLLVPIFMGGVLTILLNIGPYILFHLIRFKIFSFSYDTKLPTILTNLLLYEENHTQNPMFLLTGLSIIYGFYVFFMHGGSSRYEAMDLFNRPYLATSLRDFWGRRWNRLSSNILRQTIYDPTENCLVKFMGIGKAKVVAMVTTLVVSGMMHELMFYHITCGEKPTWEVTWFFVLHGFCMVFEAVLMKSGRVKGWKMDHPCVSVVLTLGFVVITFCWSLVLPVLRNGRSECEVRFSHLSIFF